MARAVLALEALGDGAADLDPVVEVRWVDLFRRRHEDEVRALVAEEGEVALLVAGVAVEVFAGAELRGVDEDADGHRVAAGAGAADEREVAFVE